MSTTTRPVSEPTLDELVHLDTVADRWGRMRALVAVLFGMLVWTVIWAGGPAAVASIFVGIVALVAVDVATRKAEYAAKGL